MEGEEPRDGGQIGCWARTVQQLRSVHTGAVVGGRVEELGSSGRLPSCRQSSCSPKSHCNTRDVASMASALVPVDNARASPRSRSNQLYSARVVAMLRVHMWTAVAAHVRDWVSSAASTRPRGAPPQLRALRPVTTTLVKLRRAGRVMAVPDCDQIRSRTSGVTLIAPSSA